MSTPRRPRTWLSRLATRGASRGPRRTRLDVEPLEGRAPLTRWGAAPTPLGKPPSRKPPPAAAQATRVNPRPAGTLTAGDVDYFRVTPPVAGVVRLRVHAPGVKTRLSLLGPNGELLVQSNGASAS